MAEIRCPKCGRNNPDILDVCQFCQTPLKPESVLRIGQTPTKKTTGELEAALPDWLKDVRQQARDSAEADAAVQAAAQARSPKEEPADLLAGLASQANNAEGEDVPDWLASLNPDATSKPETPSAPETSTDFFAQFNQSTSKPTEKEEEPASDAASWSSIGEQFSPASNDELSDWFSQASQQPEQAFELDSGFPSADNLSQFSTAEEKPAPKEEEDLSWLRNLEETARQTGELPAPRQASDWQANFDLPSSPSAGGDLSWLDGLGGIEEPSQPASDQPSQSQNDLSWLDQFDRKPAPPEPSQPAAPQEDLSWVNNLGSSPTSQPFESTPEQASPFAPSGSEDLSWLNNLGAAPTSQAFESTPEQEDPVVPAGSGEDLSWLNQLGATEEPTQPPETAAEQTASEDLGWLKNFGNTPAPGQPDNLSWLDNIGGEPEPFTASPFIEPPAQGGSPRQTAPLGQSAAKDEEPDWLKSAIERPSMPAPGDVSMDWFKGTQQPAEEKPATPPEPAALSNQEVDSLFSVDLPDWLSQPATDATQEQTSQAEGVPPAQADELAPVDLPSWVQAMRPVEAVITEDRPSVSDQPTETEGPLAGLQGVIPIGPIGSSRRPRAVSLKLQASDEQQASAALLEQILASETSPRALVASSAVAPQQWLRWVLTGLFLIVLSAMLFLRSQSVPISASVPVEADHLSTAVMNIPAGSKVLIVLDYEPSLAGEMEAISAPFLDQLISSTHSNLSFISTSPTGTALVDRLMGNTKIAEAGSQYANLGFLPGGATGVLGFLESPTRVNPLADVGAFSEYSAVVLLTDRAESGRTWIEQLQNQKQVDAAITNQPLLLVTSAQAGPLLQPYVLSGQVNGLISGMSDAARYAGKNGISATAVRSYWDTFGIGLMMSIAVIVIGSLWSLFTGISARRAETKPG